jgi:hypothetical protein
VNLTNHEDAQVTDHDQKANMLWMSFKDRMGKSEFGNMAYDLSSLLTEHDLECIDSLFS